MELLEIAVTGLEQKLLAYERPNLDLKVGMDISIRIDSSEMLVFDMNMI